MLIATLALAASVLAQQPSAAAPQEIPLLKAGLGACSADFTVKNADGTPAYLAAIHVRVRYGMMHVKRMDLEVGANVEGKARIEGLPNKAPVLAYTIERAGAKASVQQDLKSACHSTFDVALR